MTGTRRHPGGVAAGGTARATDAATDGAIDVPAGRTGNPLAPVPEPAGGPLARDFALLERIADAEAIGEAGIGVSALADLARRDKSQVSRALARLAKAGLVERNAASRRYRLGPKVFALAARAADGRLLVAAAEPMRALARELGETVHLVALAGAEIVTLRTESPHGYRATGWVGRRVPAHHTSAGRVLLGDATAAEIERRFATASFSRSGPRARIHDLAGLVDAVAAARAAGYAIVDEEFEAGVAGVSAPIRDFRGAVVAALNVSAPAERLRPHLVTAGERTRATAGVISGELGWPATARQAAELAGPS